ncbi:hypothetical protein DAMA08_013200 [Martiniozyma asiatica (nom. inval.)]|nr:hypothetical protein DAMA08_013200 [Martiniozyma asiatica]
MVNQNGIQLDDLSQAGQAGQAEQQYQQGNGEQHQVEDTKQDAQSQIEREVKEIFDFDAFEFNYLSFKTTMFSLPLKTKRSQLKLLLEKLLCKVESKARKFDIFPHTYFNELLRVIRKRKPSSTEIVTAFEAAKNVHVDIQWYKLLNSMEFGKIDRSFQIPDFDTLNAHDLATIFPRPDRTPTLIERMRMVYTKINGSVHRRRAQARARFFRDEELQQPQENQEQEEQEEQPQQALDITRNVILAHRIAMMLNAPIAKRRIAGLVISNLAILVQPMSVFFFTYFDFDARFKNTVNIFCFVWGSLFCSGNLVICALVKRKSKWMDYDDITGIIINQLLLFPVLYYLPSLYK